MNVVLETRASVAPVKASGVGNRSGIGAVSALLAVIVSSWSHLRGGGSASGVVDLVPLLVAAPLVGAVAGHRRWSFGALISALVVLQPAVHMSMSRHEPGMGGSSSMTAVQHGSSPWAMVVMHAVGVVTVAVTLRYGWRWVSTMPALLAVAIGPQRITVWCRTPEMSTLATECFRAPSAPRRIVNWSRGPPR